MCFTGQVPTSLLGKDAFQEVDIVDITTSICKYAVRVQKREELGTIIRQAFYIAKTGRPGVVVVDFPKDIQKEYGNDFYLPEQQIQKEGIESALWISQMEKALELLNHGKKPLFLVGGGVRLAHAEQEMRRLAERTGVPVVTTIMGKGVIPTTHPIPAASAATGLLKSLIRKFPCHRAALVACQQKCQSDPYSCPKSCRKFCRIRCGQMQAII